MGDNQATTSAKKKLRSKVRQLEAGLEESYKKEASQKIQANIQKLPPYQEARTVFLFVSKDPEPNTLALIESSLEEGKIVGVPLVLGPGEMEIRKLTSLDDLHEGHFGILEPNEGTQTIEKASIDFALIPCLTCNQAGERLGKGGGYYDRFLADFKGDPAMVCFAKTMVETIPTGPFDQAVPIVVSEENIYLPGR